MSSAPPSEGTPPPNLSTGAFMPLHSLRKRWKIGAAIASVMLIIGLPVAWIKGDPIYAVTAVIYVAPRFVNILQEGSGQEIASYQAYRQFVEQQSRTIGRYDILVDALRRMGERSKVWQLPGETERRAAERLQASLKITAIKDTYLITVGLEAAQREGLDEVVNSVVDTYLMKVRGEDLFYAADQRLANLRSQRETLVGAITKSNKRRLEIAQELGVTTFSDRGVNPFDQLLADSRNALAEATRERMEADARADAFDATRNKDGAAALAAATSELVAKDGGLFTLKSNLNQRRTKLLEAFSGLNPEHPIYAQVKGEIDEIDNELGSETKKVTETVRAMLLEQRLSEARLTRQIERQLSEQLDQSRQKASWFAERYDEGVRLTDEIERDRTQLDAIDKRIGFLELESNAPGFIRMESPARPPEIPIGGGKKKPLMMALVAALALGLGIPILIDLLDRRIRTAGQVHKILGHAPLASLLADSSSTAIRRVLADQKRRLSLALERERREQGADVMLMTSVKAGAGVTSLAFDLAREFDLFGVRALVVEVNPVQPDARYRVSATHDGLFDVLAADVPAASAIVPAEGALPDRLGIGLTPEAHLFGYHKLDALLTELKQQYRVILLDAPPVLLSADVEYLAGSADLTLLLIGAMQVMPGELRRAAAILERARPKAISFVVTHLEVTWAGGYYAKMVRDFEEAEAAAIKNLGSQSVPA
ncbi:chain length determinant protein [Methylolobus aquaticus]|nr:chain length determinant protein [Methylolobus aquaticus]